MKAGVTRVGERADIPTGSGGIGDDELITAWGVLAEALNETEPLVLCAVASGGEMAGPWFDVLIRLRSAPGNRLPMSHLAREVCLSSGGFTKLADRMERKGLLVRDSCTADRRVVYAALTPEGREFADRAHADHLRRLREHVLAPLGEDGLRQLTELARRLRDSSRSSSGAD
ncbi:hypothetical protein GCM10027570_26600 [Streptomonospora sediminis]